MTYAFPQYGIPYHAFPSYTIPYEFLLNSTTIYIPLTGEIEYLSVPISSLPDFAVPSSSVGGTYLKVYLQNIAPSPLMYKTISDFYSSCYTQILSAQNLITSAASYLSGIDSIEAKVDLFGIFHDAKNVIIDNGNLAKLLSAVTTLNTSVLLRSGKNDINDWLDENNVRVKTNWATMCEATGTIIDTEYIKD